MLPEELPREPLPPFVRLRTVPAMKKVAIGLVIIKKTIAEIRRAEDYLLGGGVTNEEFERTTTEIAEYAQSIVEQADGVIGVLEKMDRYVKVYEKELRNALG